MLDATLGIDWANYKNLRVSDIHKKVRYRVRDYMLEYFRNNYLLQVLYKSIENKSTEDKWVKFIDHILENDCSIMVTDQTTNEIRAVALLQWMTPEWRSWSAIRILITCPILYDLCTLMRQLCADYEENYAKVQDSKNLHIFFLQIDNDLLIDPCFMKLFFNVISEVARHMKMSQVTYVGLSNYDRSIIREHNFKEVATIMYSMFTLRKHRRPFDAFRDINEMHATLFARMVEPLRPYQDMIIRHEHLSTKEEPKKKQRVTANDDKKLSNEQQIEDD